MLDPFVVLRGLLRYLLPVIDRHTEPPIMRQRINAGSDQYFAEQAEMKEDPSVRELFEPFDGGRP